MTWANLGPTRGTGLHKKAATLCNSSTWEKGVEDPWRITMGWDRNQPKKWPAKKNQPCAGQLSYKSSL